MNPTTRPRSLPYFLSPIPPKNILLTLRHQSINGNSLHSKIYSASQWMETLTMNEVRPFFACMEIQKKR